MKDFMLRVCRCVILNLKKEVEKKLKIASDKTKDVILKKDLGRIFKQTLNEKNCKFIGY